MDSIYNFTLVELENILTNWKQPCFHARQILSWIYQKNIKDFDQMSNLSLDLRKRLKDNFCLSSIKLIKVLMSIDGTKKLLLELKDKNLIEAVIIPAKERVTGCISTQVGCRFGCSFCASGRLGFKRNLTCAEIVQEVLYLKNNSPCKKLTHLVFMGMGEPLDNYDNVLKAIRIINSPFGFNIGARRITISTVGLIEGIEKLSAEGLQIELSISLHAADEKTRSLIIPINKRYSLKALILAAKKYIKKTNRQITFEYILIKGINSDLQNAKNLGKILRGLNCKVNLIPANGLGEFNIEPPPKSEILLFRDSLLNSGINVTLRKPRGQDIEAGCGQLRLRYEK